MPQFKMKCVSMVVPMWDVFGDLGILYLHMKTQVVLQVQQQQHCDIFDILWFIYIVMSICFFVLWIIMMLFALDEGCLL